MGKPVGLRTEILLTLSLLMGAALLFGGLLMLRSSEQNILTLKTSQLRALTKVVANSIEVDQINDRTEDILNQLPEELLLQGWWLYNRDLQLVKAFKVEQAQPLSEVNRKQVMLSGEAFEIIEFPPMLGIYVDVLSVANFIQPIFQEGQLLGLLEIHYSLNDVRNRLLSLQSISLLYVFLYGAILVFVGYYLLQRNVIKPARNLLKATEAVSYGNLKTRLPVAGPLEIASLATSYNQMVVALQESRKETHGHISSLELINQELQRTQDELIRSEKLSSVGKLAAGLAHELGNPLAALIGYLEILKAQLKDDDNEVVSRALIEAERIDLLVREMLDFSRPSTALTEVLDPAVALLSAVTLLEHQGAFDGVLLENELPEEIGKIRINSHKLQQLYVNLLLNAIHACQGPTGKVSLWASADDEKIWVEIRDTGCGMDHEVQKKIFDPFFTTKAPGEGTGLGLSVCHRIIEEVNGQILVESQLGHGSCFRIFFSKI